MKKLVLMAMAIVSITVLMGSCNSKLAPEATDDSDSTTTEVDRNQTIYGICSEGSAMNTLQLLTDNGDTLELNLNAAQEGGKVFGGFQVGDRMAVLTNSAKTDATLVINLSTLMGNWVMPNPLDGSSEMGIRIKDGGVAESIEQSSLIYKTWRLVDGQLELTAVRDGGGEEEEITLYDIVTLGADSLVIKDTEDTFEYSRQGSVKDELSDIELEEASADDYNI